jgi:hypothetical protein
MQLFYALSALIWGERSSLFIVVAEASTGLAEPINHPRTQGARATVSRLVIASRARHKSRPAYRQDVLIFAGT